MKISELVLSIEKQIHLDLIDYKSENTDVIVKLEDGTRYIASFFTYRNVVKLETEHQQNGEYLNGKYFWSNNLVLIESCSKENVLEVVEHMIDEGDFNQVFKKL